MFAGLDFFLFGIRNFDLYNCMSMVLGEFDDLME